MRARIGFGQVFGVAALSAALLSSANAENIAVSNYGVAANSMPYAVALEKKFYQQQGATVTGIISSGGGGTSNCAVCSSVSVRDSMLSSMEMSSC